MQHSPESIIALLLWSTIKKKRNAGLINAIIKDSRFTQFKIGFSSWWCTYISNLEMTSSNSFLKSGSLNKSTSILSEEGYVPLIEELGAINLDFNGKKFLMVGCGPFPETLCFVSNHYKVSEIYGMDSNLEAIKNAEKILQIISLHNNMKLIHLEAQNFDFSRIDIVFMANGLRNKSDILDQVYKTSHNNIEVITRNPINLAGLLYEDINDYITESKKWVITKRYRSSALGETILIKKDGQI